MTRRFGVILSMLCGFGIATTACNNNETTAPGVRDLLGPPTSVGNGTARTFVTLSGEQPVSLGIEMTDAALQNLPATESEWQLALPPGAELAQFDHATLDWNPHGHPPPGIYMVPHFDFHFYMISPSEQQSVQGGPDTTHMAASYIPQDYVPDPVAVPEMGVHWTDSQAPEFHGQPFDRTFIYGSYHGAFTFMEPMVALAFLQSHPNVEMAVKQPQSVQKAGLYPTHYSVHYDASNKMLRISLDSLVARQ